MGWTGWGSRRGCFSSSTPSPPDGNPSHLRPLSAIPVIGITPPRWESQVREGMVRQVMASELASMLQDGWTLLDVRPPHEVLKARVTGAVEVPVFVMDDRSSLSTLLKQATAFGMGGWWLGGGHMVANAGFLQQVEARVPRSARVVVACQKGLRSLAACEQLLRAGYAQVAWINGGFDASQRGEVPTVDGIDVRCGTHANATTAAGCCCCCPPPPPRCSRASTYASHLDSLPPPPLTPHPLRRPCHPC